MLKKIKLFIIVAAVLVGGTAYLYTRIFGEGELHLVAIGDAGAEVVLDGKPLVMRRGNGDHLVFDVPQGPHSAVVTDKSTGKSVTYSLNVENGLSKLLLPVRAEQCFVRFDMTEAAYANKGDSGGDAEPIIRDRYVNASAPFEVPSSTYFTLDEMPNKRRKRETINLIRDLPCSFMDKGDELLLAALSDESDSLYALTDEGGELEADEAPEADAAPEAEAKDTP
jgi:hypothetical protein